MRGDAYQGNLLSRRGTVPPVLRVLVVVAVCALALSFGCAASRGEASVAFEELAWPNVEPRIRFDSLIKLAPQGVGRPGGFRALIGADPRSTDFRRPFAVAWDGDDVLVADPDTGVVARIDARGKIRTSSKGVLENPTGVASCSDGIVVTDAGTGKIALYDRDLKLVRWLAEDMSRPTGVACDGERIFVAETAAHRIVVLDRDGARRELGSRGNAPGQYNFPTFLTINAGELIVVDSMNFRVQRIDTVTGRSLDAFGELGDAPGEMPRVKGVAVDSAGKLWIVDAHLDLISVFDLDGTYLLSFGGTGGDPGQFSFPAGIASNSNGQVVVADSFNGRLQLFSVLGDDTQRLP